VWVSGSVADKASQAAAAAQQAAGTAAAAAQQAAGTAAAAAGHAADAVKNIFTKLTGH
jgi:hypothetical protein